MNALAVIRERKTELAKVAKANEALLNTLPESKRDEFKANFMELAQNDYLMQKIAPKEILKFAIDITKVGVNINPIAKECYILPFDTKIGDQKVMIPQAVFPDNGLKQIAYKSGMFLKIDPVYLINGKVKAESELSREEQASIRSTDEQWVEEALVGYDIILEDLREEIPTQKKFIEAEYCKEVTKTLKDKRFKIQTWKHKAARRAFSDFFIPSNRNQYIFEKVDHVNENVVIDVEEEKEKKTVKNPVLGGGSL